MVYVIGAKSEPDSNDPSYELWDEENSVVMSWLLHSTQLKINQTYSFLSTTKEIVIMAHVNELKCQINATKQGSWSMTEYYNKLQSLWLELDHYQHIEMVDAVDTTRLKKIM